MKRINKFLAFTAVVFTLMPFLTFAAGIPTDAMTNPAAKTSTDPMTSPAARTATDAMTNSAPVSTLDNPLKVNSVGELVKSALQVFSYIAVLIAVVMFVVVGLQYILSRGNPEKMKEASRWLLYIVIGTAIVIGARVAVTIIINTLSATGIVDPGVIQSAQNANK